VYAPRRRSRIWLGRLRRTPWLDFGKTFTPNAVRTVDAECSITIILLLLSNNNNNTPTTPIIFVYKAEEKDDVGPLKRMKCMTPARSQHQWCTLNRIHTPSKMSGQFNLANPPLSTHKQSLDGLLSHYHDHVAPTQSQPLQPHQLAVMMYLRLQMLYQLVFHVVDVAKCVPGFQLMTQHDQLHVIKRQCYTSASSSSSSSRVVITRITSTNV